MGNISVRPVSGPPPDIQTLPAGCSPAEPYSTGDFAEQYKLACDRYKRMRIEYADSCAAWEPHRSRWTPTSMIGARTVRACVILSARSSRLSSINCTIGIIRWLNMTNTGKVLIIGLLVIDLGVGGYLLFPKDDERPPAATGAVVSETDVAPSLGLPASAARMASGSVIGATPSAGAADQPALAASVPFVSMAPPELAPRVAAPPVVAAAPHSTRGTPRVADKPPATSRAPASAEARRDARAKSKPVQLAEQGRGRKQDDSHRRESKPTSKSKSVSTTMTARLVKESARPDPSLPLPPSSAHGSHPVAAAMTDQLVRESSRVSAPPQSNSQYGKH